MNSKRILFITLVSVVLFSSIIIYINNQSKTDNTGTKNGQPTETAFTNISNQNVSPITTTTDEQFKSLGKWKIEYGEKDLHDGSPIDPYNPSGANIGYSGNETIEVWQDETIPKADIFDVERVYLKIKKADLKKFPVDVTRINTKGIILDPNTLNVEKIKKQLEGTSEQNPLKLNIKSFKLTGNREIYISTDLSTIYDGDWKFIRGDLTDNCSSPTYVGKVQVRGWLIKISCDDVEAYCAPLAFQVVNEEIYKLPKNFKLWSILNRHTYGQVYFSDYGAEQKTFKQIMERLSDSSKQNPKTVELNRFSWYCEGPQPHVDINRVL